MAESKYGKYVVTDPVPHPKISARAPRLSIKEEIVFLPVLRDCSRIAVPPLTNTPYYV